MDESWRMRMRMGMRMPTAAPPPKTTTRTKLPNYPPRRSTEDQTSHRRKAISGDISDDPLNPEDFTDVFGGPPRTILSGQFSTGFPRSSSSSFFYDEIFRPPENVSPLMERIGRSLKEFRIPTKSVHSEHNRQNNGFYSTIFGWDDENLGRSRSRSKTSSSSVLSSEELSPPLRPEVSVDDDVSLFASKLRPINVRSRWNSSRMGQEDYKRQHNMPLFAGSRPIYSTENDSLENFRDYPFGLSRRNASPETINLEPMSNSSFRVSADDLELNSPSSAVSSVCQSDRDQKTRDIEDDILMQDAIEQEEDEAMSSYVIEINSDIREGTSESNGVDEAIAWAKEKFQTLSSESKWGTQECDKEKHTEEILSGNQLSEGHTDSFGSLDEQQDKWAAEEEIQPFESKVQTEMQILDEKIRLWSTGKESDIRLLLSSLHHILWPNSGWFAIPLTNVIESAQVKKAYQKARLCLHPDKLQQRGATLPQKYIAEKAFSVLQDAWAAFTSQDVFCVEKLPMN